MTTNNATNTPQLTTDGQIIYGVTGGIPGVNTIGAGVGISVTTVAGRPIISATGDINQHVEVTGTSQAMTVSTEYLANNAALVTLTLPSTAAIFEKVFVGGKGAGLFKIAQNSGQTINLLGTPTTTGTGGSLIATEQYGSIEVECIATNTTWRCNQITGNFTVV